LFVPAEKTEDGVEDSRGIIKRRRPSKKEKNLSEFPIKKLSGTTE
jgi:hypothetical protein